MKKRNIKKAFAKNLELPEELVTGASKISVTDFSELFILNYQSLVEYTDSVIRINTSKKLVKIEGEELFIKNITDGELTVTGAIKNILFE